MKKFNNAYDLMLFLYNEGLFKGVYVGLRGEYQNETSIRNPKILSFLEELWHDYAFIYGGFYNLILIDKRGEKLILWIIKWDKKWKGHKLPVIAILQQQFNLWICGKRIEAELRAIKP